MKIFPKKIDPDPLSCVLIGLLAPFLLFLLMVPSGIFVKFFMSFENSLFFPSTMFITILFTIWFSSWILYWINTD